jgi:hypothetical protein
VHDAAFHTRSVRERGALLRPRDLWRTTPHITAESDAAIVVLGIIGTGFAYVPNYHIITARERPSYRQ